jgi:hypothetical protein
MRMLRRFSLLGLALLLAAGVSCTSSDSTTNEALGPSTEQQQQQSPSYGLIGDLTGGLTDLTGDLTGTLGGLTDSSGTLTGSSGSLTGTIVGTLGNITDLLSCSSQPYAVTVKGIDRNGGTIIVGTHRLDIPRDAFPKKVMIKAEQIPGSTNSVRFSPEGLNFERPATLTMSYENCTVVLLRKHIVYTDESLKILEVLRRSLDLFHRKTVSAPIDHFSRYAIAY